MGQAGTIVEDAVALLLERTTPSQDQEILSLPEAVGRVAAEAISARLDQPPFDRSPLDGYALNHADTAPATASAPVWLRVVREIFAGDPPGGPVTPGEAVRVMTGAPLPPGTDCVLRQEDASRNGDQVAAPYPLGRHQNYCFRGEDVKAGTLLLPRGQRLDCVATGILAAQGLAETPVFPRPRVGILSTGSELTALGEPLGPGQIYNSNSYTLAARCLELGAEPVIADAAPDRPEALVRTVVALAGRADFVVTTGGVSVGARDYMPRVGELLGVERLFHGIDCKPGGPAMALALDGKLILCLSGNPFAALVTFELLAGPVIRKLAGLTEVLPKRVSGVLRGSFPKASAGRRFLRARMEGGDIHLERDGHAAGSLASMAGCNCLVDVPAGSPPLAGGERLEAWLL